MYVGRVVPESRARHGALLVLSHAVVPRSVIVLRRLSGPLLFHGDLQVSGTEVNDCSPIRLEPNALTGTSYCRRCSLTAEVEGEDGLAVAALVPSVRRGVSRAVERATAAVLTRMFRPHSSTPSRVPNPSFTASCQVLPDSSPSTGSRERSDCASFDHRFHSSSPCAAALPSALSCATTLRLIWSIVWTPVIGTR